VALEPRRAAALYPAFRAEAVGHRFREICERLHGAPLHRCDPESEALGVILDIAPHGGFGHLCDCVTVTRVFRHRVERFNRDQRAVEVTREEAEFREFQAVPHHRGVEPRFLQPSDHGFSGERVHGLQPHGPRCDFSDEAGETRRISRKIAAGKILSLNHEIVRKRRHRHARLLRTGVP
jgi:hypothetical protein